MRASGVAWVLAITLSLSLAGCLEVPLGEDDGPEGSGDDEPQVGGSQGNGQGEPDEKSLDDDTGSDPDNQGSSGETDESGNTAQDLACEEQERPDPAHPTKHEVGTEAELKCPGHYTILSQGDGDSWNPPAWKIGDWWQYQHDSYNGVSTSCAYQSKERVIADDGEVLGVPVYTLEIETFHCDGEPTGYQPRTENRTQNSLAVIEDDGFIDHRLILPLQEGKTWAFVLEGCRDGECTQAKMNEVSYNGDGGLLSSGASWDTKWTFSGSKGDVTFEASYSVPQKNLQEEVMWVDGIASAITTKTLIDSNIDGETKDNPLRLP